MPRIVERRQELDLDDPWVAVKWDESSEFKGGFDAALRELTGDLPTKAADVVGVLRDRTRPRILIAEFKDFCHPNIPAEQRARIAREGTSDRVLGDIVRKVIDTLCASTFAHSDESIRCEELEHWRRAVGRRAPQLLVLVCVELPVTQELAVLAWTKRLRQRLRWLGPDAQIIVSSGRRPFSAAGVSYRLSSPRPRTTTAG